MHQLPALFRQQMMAQLGDEFPDFEAALNQPPPVSIRVNPRKNHLDTSQFAPIPWCDTGFYLPERPVFTLDPLFQAGAYYVQEASSMLLAEALRQTSRLTRQLRQHPLRVLDLCAAPGGKTTLLASMLSTDSLLVSNEVIRTRVPILRENVDKWGYPTILVSNHDPDAFLPLAGFFDVVLVDAPCSGEGLFRKDPKAMQEWSDENVALCSARQKRILTQAAQLVTKGGTLIYSTCTYNDDENGQNARFLLSQGFTTCSLTLPDEWGVVTQSAGGVVGYQCYPHRVRGEGFFISVFRKTAFAPHTKTTARQFRSIKPLPARRVGEVSRYLTQPDDFSFWIKPNDDVMALPKALEKDLLLLDTALYNKGFGLEMGLFKGNDFVPAHALALSTAVAPTLPGVNLSREDALRYFKKENLVLDASATGWLLARYQTTNLGWMKAIGTRVNNYLPKDWRIRMDIPEY